MDRVEIGAHRPCVKVDVKGPTLAHGYFASLSPQGGGNRHNERRSYGDNPLAYFRSKTVQTMGGSSDIHISGTGLPCLSLIKPVTKEVAEGNLSEAFYPLLGDVCLAISFPLIISLYTWW